MNLRKIIGKKKPCVFKDKPSCIDELKELVESLSDRDTLLKSDYKTIKSIINNKALNNTQKIDKIKSLLDGSK
tara:strand:+ start:459 stop:677 length:219 start_codon:yes stop_codon:yes gene_type:complete